MNKRKAKYNSKGVSLKLIGWITSVIAIIVSGLLIFSTASLSAEHQVVRKTTDLYLDTKDAASDIQLASDYLTDQVRTFVVKTDDRQPNRIYMDNYFEEVYVTKRRDNAHEVIHKSVEKSSVHDVVHKAIDTAFEESKELENLEYKAMKLFCISNNIDYSKYQDVVNANIEDIDPSNYEKAAVEAVFGKEYMDSKEIISSNITKAILALDSEMERNVKSSSEKLTALIVFQTVLIVINIAFVGVLLFVMYFFVINPMNHTVEALLHNKEVDIHSNREFNYMAETYNRIHAQNEHIKEKLIYEAEHDKLTGLYNRTGYDSIYRRMRLNRVIYVLLDIDKFKDINDEYGHETGDRVLVRTAAVLDDYFNDENSYIFRIGGDEFAILIEDAGIEMNEIVAARCRQMDEELSHKQGTLPGATLSIGIAHGTEKDTTDSLYRKADAALYKIKKAGRADVALYSDKE